MKGRLMATLKSLCQNRRVKLGTYVGEFITPGIGHILRSAGCDFVLFGMEHGGFSIESMKIVLRAMEAATLPVIVQIPTQTYADISSICDIGTEGIMTPMTATVEQACQALDSMKYPPQGKRGCGMPLAYERYRGTMAERMAAANARTVYVPLIENVLGVQNVDAIAAIEGVDAIWVGHLDLSISLGIPDQLDHPRFLDALQRVAAAGQRHNKTVGILAASVDQGRRFYGMGCDMICYGEDVLVYHDAISTGLSQLRKELVVPN
jgi:2-dehydro-3-deoxyglucarate aldolase/4-hydroxy-2-oxoheptanedioate aldolase